MTIIADLLEPLDRAIRNIRVLVRRASVAAMIARLEALQRVGAVDRGPLGEHLEVGGVGEAEVAVRGTTDDRRPTTDD